MDNKNHDRYLTKLQEIINNSYSPYSKFRVACLLLTDGGWFYGVNVENSAYSGGICAERSAATAMVSSGFKKILAVYVLTDSVTNNGTPCGICRQFLNEFAANDVPITIYNALGNKQTYTLGELLPLAFDGKALQIK